MGEENTITFTHLSRNLRKSQTEVESLIWQRLRSRQLQNYKFRRQFPVEPYIVDFACLELRLIIELDGSQHSEQVDKERTLFLTQRGVRVLRFWNNEVFNNLEGVLEKIRLTIEERARDLE